MISCFELVVPVMFLYCCTKLRHEEFVSNILHLIVVWQHCGVNIGFTVKHWVWLCQFQCTTSFQFFFTLFVSCPVCWYINCIQFSFSYFILFESQSQFCLSKIWCLILLVPCTSRYFLCWSFVEYWLKSDSYALLWCSFLCWLFLKEFI